MKVLVKGREQKGWADEFSCPHCKAKLLVEESDLYYRKFQHFDDTTIVYRYDCGHCGCPVDIDREDVPGFVNIRPATAKERNNG